jgi:anaerobic magnesium-protoporphyrin IX monomethyl ester cyclase
MRILLVVYDNDSFIHWFPQGLGYIATILLDMGIDVEIYNQDLHHYPDEHLKEYLDENRFDVVCLSVIAGYYQYRKLLSLSKYVNDSKNRPILILGGHGPSPEPKFFIRKTEADIIVIGEGEMTCKELFLALERKKPLEEVKGIAWRNGNEVIINQKRELIKDVDSIPMPAFELFPMQYYRLLRMPHCSSSDFVFPVLSGRGCPFKCNFCYRMDEGFRPRSIESIIEEIKYLQHKWGITYIAFSDELLMSSVSRTEEICHAFIKERLNIKWDCNGRLNFAKENLLKLMRKAGCVFINYGIESFDDQILKNMKKGLTTKQIVNGIEATLLAGISPGFNIIFGNIGENNRTLSQGVNFLLKYDDGAQMRTIRPVTPYPGCELYYNAIERGLVKDAEDFFENKHLNSDLLAVNFTELTDTDFYDALSIANKTLLANYFDKRKASLLRETEMLYRNKDVSFRGFRNT